LDTLDWLHWNGDLDNPNDSKEDCTADNVMGQEQANCIEDPECPGQWDVSSEPIVPGLIQPAQMSKRHPQKLLMTVNVIEMRRNKAVIKK